MPLRSIAPFTSLFLALLLLALPVAAQDNSVAPVAPDEDPTTRWDYAKPTTANIARTYWAFNKFEVNNQQALENFLKLTECQFFNENYGDDFAWKKILRQTGQYIKANIEEFPYRYTFTQPVSLKRYDFERNGFPLAERSAYKGIRDLQIAADLEAGEACDDIRARFIKGYPANVAFQFQRPFSLTFFPLAERHAKDYLDYVENILGDTKYQRPAYVKFYVKFSKFLGKKSFKNTGRKPHAVFIGELEKYEIYADRRMQNRLYTHVPGHMKRR